MIKKKLSFVFSLLLFITCNYSSNARKCVTLDTMTTRQKIGQMIMLDFRCLEFRDFKAKPVLKVDDTIKNIIEKYHVGNVILYAENFDEVEQSKKLVHDLKNAGICANGVPMIIATDQEGGKVQRIKFNGRHKENADLLSANDAYNKGKLIAEDLINIGVNCNLAPVVDINSNPDNPVIGVRSFGDNPKVVATFALSFVKALHECGVLATAKHFPGHGDTSKDSHFDLPTVNKDENEIFNFELFPFKVLIDNGIDMIMTAHIIFNKIDDVPATLSKKILTDILRKNLRFNGIIITDSMDMKAITKFESDTNKACKMSIMAGADILCTPVKIRKFDDIEKLNKFYEYLENEYNTDLDFRNRVNESVSRILKLKKYLRYSENPKFRKLISALKNKSSKLNINLIY